MDRVYGKKDSEEMTGILNANCKRGAKVPRTLFNKDGKRDVEELETFSATALAGIDRGNLYPDTVEDRSIPLILPRRNRRDPREKKEQFRFRNYEKDCTDLKREIEQWAKPRIELARKIIPEMAEGIEDRNADNWEPLLIVARLLDMGDVTSVTDVTDATPFPRGVWETRAMKAALDDLSSEDYSSDAEDGPALLRDIFKIITGDPLHKYDFVSNTYVPSAYLLDKLRKLEDAPWSYMNVTKRQLEGRQMASILRLHGIKRPNKQGTIRVNGETVKGYDLLLFRDPLQRYCPDLDIPAPSRNAVTSVTPVKA